MVRIKKITLAALVALAVAAGGLVVGGEAAQVAGAKGGSSRVGRESASLQVTPAELQQVAGSRGSSSTFGRESS